MAQNSTIEKDFDNLEKDINSLKPESNRENPFLKIAEGIISGNKESKQPSVQTSSEDDSFDYKNSPLFLDGELEDIQDKNESYKTTPLYLDDEIEENILESLSNLRISGFIIHEACKKYMEVFKDNYMPLSFVEFYFEEFEKYQTISPKFLPAFFKSYNVKNLQKSIDDYYQSEYSLIDKRRVEEGQTYYRLNRKWDALKLSSPLCLGKLNPQLYKELDLIDEKMDHTDELVSVKELYEYFMMKKVVLETKPTAKVSTVSKQETKVVVNSTTPTKQNQMLVGDKTDLPEQQGKVTKILFPKLALPSAYPTGKNVSRVNSDYKVKKFMSNDRQIILINDYKFNSVKYRESYIQKRKVATPKPKKKLFDFDF